MTQKPPFHVTIDLGKGVKLNIPFKKHWSVAEWRRMASFIDASVKSTPEFDDYK